MPRKSPQTYVNPAVLRWARESDGASVEETAKRLSIEPSEVEQLESGIIQPTLTQLKVLAEYYKRPLAAFLLPKPPVEIALPWEFRTLRQGRNLSRITRRAIRRARNLQSIAAQLVDASHENKPFSKRVSLSDDPEVVSQSERMRLGVDIEEQIRWRDSSEAFRQWRLKIEDRRVFVFVMSMPMADGRGFSLTDPPFSIVVNGKDSDNGRIFTLLHEYGHILLAASDALSDDHSPQQIENWCNAFAGATLAPERELRVIAEQWNRSTQELDMGLLWDIAKRFKVSSLTILRRMRSFDMLDQTTFDMLNSSLSAQQNARTVPNDVAGGPPPYTRCLHEKGRLFVSLVLDGMDRGVVDHAEVTEYLSLNLKHLNTIESLIAR